MKGPGKEASATRVISQPQMLDKSKEADLLLDDIQKGRSDYLEEKSLPYSFPRCVIIPLARPSTDELLATCLRQRMYWEPHHT
ncbi:dynein axonemal heavy chain 3-like [Diceros bicornis minor]|uniref:dynein axonemal heavy chain 3-like n=1 Tax=Diceros bicornis minor TaxID=77932 RepID=UPI0026F0AA78|nr:dynein axonemal heavy chain 3-like [Diceros bicornis minor]